MGSKARYAAMGRKSGVARRRPYELMATQDISAYLKISREAVLRLALDAPAFPEYVVVRGNLYWKRHEIEKWAADKGQEHAKGETERVAEAG